jgi:DNA repair exonuclease SbcCD ATPase subunit
VCSSDLPFSAAEVEEACAAFTAARDEYMRVDSDVKLYTGLGSALSGADMTVCPVCDGEIKDPGIVERKLNDARTRLGLSSYSKAEAEYDRRRKTVEKHSRDADKAASDYATRRDMLTRSLSQADGQLAHRVRPDEDPATIRSMLALVERDLSAVRDYRVRSARLSAGIEECRRAIEAADAEIENAVWSMQNAAEFVEVYRSQGVAAVEAFARHALDECAQRQTRMQHAEVRASEIRGMLAGMKGPLDAMDEEIAQRRETLERMGARSAAVKVLSDVREWFHYRSGPRTLAVAVMERMVDGVNGFLDSLGAPFSVRTADDGLGFLCLFSDGRPMPSCNGVEARHLSGGQRMQLAIAFRLAGYCLFASRLGLLSLDEPTTYMDDANVSNFCALLPRLKDVARSMNLQIILATHAREVLSHMDTVVDLYKGN